MPRPKTKEELIALSQLNYKKLIDLVDSYSEEQLKMTFPERTLNRNIKDVIAHLHHWHFLMLDWYEVGMKGEKPAMPADGYTWKTLPEYNKVVQQQYQQTSLKTALEMLDGSSKRVQSIIASHSNDDLFTKKKYPWTGSTSMASYLISNTSSHYDWAFKLIRRSICKSV